MKMILDELKGVRIVGIVGSKHSGKTSLLISLIEEAKKNISTSLVTYFYHQEYKKLIKGVEHLFSLFELECVTNSIIFVDEFNELFNIDNRHNASIVKNFLAQIEHNNNILVLCGLPDWYKKYISGQVDKWFLMKCKYEEVVNGSSLAHFIKQISGSFKGGTILNIPIGSVLINGIMYQYKYYRKYDKKADRVKLI